VGVFPPTAWWISKVMFHRRLPPRIVAALRDTSVVYVQGARQTGKRNQPWLTS
jgi:hypothetical protein